MKATCISLFRRWAASSLVLLALPLAAQTTAEDLRIVLGKTIDLEYPSDIARVSTNNPEIVDAVVVSTRELLLQGKGYGTSTVVVWDKSGQRVFYNITVDHNLDPIKKILKETFPDETIVVQSARDTVSLNGRVSSLAVSERAAALASSLVKTVVNNLQVAASPVDKQVLLRVKFAEVNRNVSHAFGVNLLSTGALNTPGSIGTGQMTPPRPSSVSGTIGAGVQGTSSSFSLTDALNVFAFRPDLNLAATIKALQGEGVLQILAEPNLLTSDGKEASFLVGGEFPIPVLQGGGNAGSVTVQFREYGIRLTFTPVLTSHATLKMHVRPEVSTIDLANAVNLSGFLIPALATRRMETNIELGPGQSFVIGGLVDDRVQDTMAKIPGISSIPVLGVLFKSREEKKSKGELIVMVTPELVDPLNASDPKPIPVLPRTPLPPTEKPNAAVPARTNKQNARNEKPKVEKGKSAKAVDVQAKVAGEAVTVPSVVESEKETVLDAPTSTAVAAVLAAANSTESAKKPATTAPGSTAETAAAAETAAPTTPAVEAQSNPVPAAATPVAEPPVAPVTAPPAEPLPVGAAGAGSAQESH